MILCLMKSISFVALKKKKMNCFKKKKKTFVWFKNTLINEG